MRSSEVDLRPTRLADVAAVRAWERHPENAPFVQAWSARRHRAALADPTLRHFVVEADGRAAGFVILAGIGTAVIEFRRIVIAEKGRGLGRVAIAHVLAYAFRELAAEEVWLDFVAHNARARHLYTTSGFRPVPAHGLWAEIDGTPTPLIKMSITRAEYERLAS